MTISLAVAFVAFVVLCIVLCLNGLPNDWSLSPSP